MIPAVLGGGFLEPNPLDYLFGNGIGTNIGSSIIWGFLAGLIGIAVAKKIKREWSALHERLDRLHASHKELHKKLDNLTKGD